MISGGAGATAEGGRHGHYVPGLHNLLPLVKGVVIGGDLNTNKDQSLFVSEQTLDLLSSSGFKNCFSVSIPLLTELHTPGTGNTQTLLSITSFRGAWNDLDADLSNLGIRPSSCHLRFPD